MKCGAVDGCLTRNGKCDIIQAALNALDNERKLSAVMLGDRKHDILGAKAVGIDSIGVLWGYGSLEEHEDAGATRIVKTVDELYEAIMGGVDNENHATTCNTCLGYS